MVGEIAYIVEMTWAYPLVLKLHTFVYFNLNGCKINALTHKQLTFSGSILRVIENGLLLKRKMVIFDLPPAVKTCSCDSIIGSIAASSNNVYAKSVYSPVNNSFVMAARV